jgi:hypothetical protein
LREIEKENPSRRISEGLEATTSEQQQGTSARNDLQNWLSHTIHEAKEREGSKQIICNRKK